jgi:hypothetical protein
MGWVGLELATVTWSGIDPVNGFHAIQVDVYGDKPGMSPFELSHPYGFLSRPLDPEPSGKGCSAFYYRKGSAEGFAWLANDPRVQALLPEILPGESFQYGAKGQFVRCHPDGKISTFTTDDATPNGRSVFSQVAPNGFTRVAPWGRETFDASGFHVKHVSGARIDLGAIGGLPTPLDALNSYFSVSAQMARIEAAVVSLGPADIPGMPAAKATIAQASDTALLTALQTTLTAIDAVMTALGAIGALTTNPPEASSAVATAAAVVATAHGSVAAAAGAIGAAVATMPSSVMVS